MAAVDAVVLSLVLGASKNPGEYIQCIHKEQLMFLCLQ